MNSTEETYYRRYLNDLANLGPGGSGYQGQGGGSSVITSFSDSLQTQDANNPNTGKLDGSKWFFGCAYPNSSNTPLNTPSYSIGLSTKDNANALLWSNPSAQNPAVLSRAWLIPITCYLGCYGLTQFSQGTLVQTTLANGESIAGVSVMNCPANGLYWAYLFGAYTTNKNWYLLRFGRNDATLATGATNSISDGDIFRLSADLSINGQVTLTVKRNGSVLTTYVDNTSNRLLIGSPGLGALPTQGSTTPKSDWRTFSCGIGL